MSNPWQPMFYGPFLSTPLFVETSPPSLLPPPHVRFQPPPPSPPLSNPSPVSPAISFNQKLRTLKDCDLANFATFNKRTPSRGALLRGGGLLLYCILPMNPHVCLLVGCGRSVGLSCWLGGWMVCYNFRKGAKLHFHASMGARVFTDSFLDHNSNIFVRYGYIYNTYIIRNISI